MGVRYYAVDKKSKQLFELGKGNWDYINTRGLTQVEKDVWGQEFRYSELRRLVYKRFGDELGSKIMLKFRKWKSGKLFYLISDERDYDFELIDGFFYKETGTRYITVLTN